ncbi:S-phase kinase-associated protein 1, partial [Aphelenchoides avenae]
MSAPQANNVGGPRHVTCVISKKELVAVDFDDLLCAHTFSEMCETLGLAEHDEFPGVFPVRGVSSRVFKKVVGWCKEHKGLPEPIIEKDAFTQEVKWLDLTPYERQFLEIPVPALFELITAANLLDIPSLYHGACQAVAALIKGKSPVEVRIILRQRCDLSKDDLQEVFDRNPWLEKCHEQRVHIH